MNVLALFAGIGGLELGLGLAVRGARAVCYVERDAFAAACLVARMEDATLAPAPVWDDVSTFDGKPWRGVVDCIAGGFPCQDISVAGSGAGLDGARSGLWREYARIIREVGPSYVFVENVPALTFRGLDRVLGDLADLGFDAEWDVFSAAGVGAPHLRKRIFILAYRERERLDGIEQAGPAARAVRRSGGASVGDADRSRGDGFDGREPGIARHSTGRGAMGDADGGRCEGERLAQCAGQWRPSWDEPHRPDQDRRLAWPPGPGDDAGWREWIAAGLPQPAIRRGADGASYRMDRLRCLGNGVVPAVAARAWRVLGERLNGRAALSAHNE